jgi:hypothetical protein
MRTFVLAAVAGLMAVAALLGQPQLTVRAAPAADAAEVLPSESDIRTLLGGLAVGNFETMSNRDGWDAVERFKITSGPGGNGPQVPVDSWIYASEFPTEAGAAGFVQTKLQEYRNATGQIGMVGQLGPAGDELTMDADEAYFGAFFTPDGAPQRVMAAVLVLRYAETVATVDLSMQWDTPGSIDESERTGIGMVLGMLGHSVNELASE